MEMLMIIVDFVVVPLKIKYGELKKTSYISSQNLLNVF